MSEVGEAFLRRSRAFLESDFLPKIKTAVALLTEEDLWWRPNDETNAVGNLLLHLEGNVRQWIVSGVGGLPDHRDRQSEFDQRDRLPAAVLVEGLTEAVNQASAVLATFSPEQLLERRTIQGRQATVLGAIYHVVEHFSMHTGQILYIAKLRTGRDLGLYEVVDGVPKPTWGREGLH